MGFQNHKTLLRCNYIYCSKLNYAFRTEHLFVSEGKICYTRKIQHQN